MSARRTPMEWLDWRWPVIVRYAGLTLAGWSILIDHVERPSVLVLAGGMMGLKDVISVRDKRKNGAAS